LSPRARHVLGVVVTVLCGAAIEAFGPSGPWAHVGVGGLVVALATQLKTAIGGQS
jgi:hypothetical protein